jgi:hypothetical protein
MKVTAGATRPNAPITAPEYASSSAVSSVGAPGSLSNAVHCGRKPLDDELIDPLDEDCRIVQVAALGQHRLVIEHLGEIGESRLIARLLEPLDEGMFRIQLEDGQRRERIVLTGLFQDAAHPKTDAKFAGNQHRRGIREPSGNPRARNLAHQGLAEPLHGALEAGLGGGLFRRFDG